jgi:hypothetical protein
LHWHRPLAPSTDRFVNEAHFWDTRTGRKLAIEVTAYAPGHVAVSTSVIDESIRPRAVGQSQTLMFNDPDEAKDAIDALIDRLVEDAIARRPG